MLQPYSTSLAPAADQQLFSGIWIRWSALTRSERFIVANIVLFPLWWIAGLLYYMPLLLLGGVLGYQWRQHEKLRLTFPSPPVLALMAFGMYQILRTYFFGTISNQVILDNTILSFCPACWLWYIQSYKIRVRLPVVTWAFSVCILQILILWLSIQSGITAGLFYPPKLRTLFAILTRKGLEGFSEVSSHNFLAPYQPYGNLQGQPRYNFFFIYPEFFALVVGFIGLVALDVRNRIWSGALLAICVFLLVLSGTRALLVAFPLMVVTRYLLPNLKKPFKLALMLAAIAVLSFMVLSVPPVSAFLTSIVSDSTESIEQFRADSSAIRLEIYHQTWKGFLEQPLWGHAEKGPVVNPYIPFARVGTHSFILGNLLYMNGLVGTIIFCVFWFSLIRWFYQTRSDRPYAGLCLLLLYTLVAPTLELVYETSISSLLILMGAALQLPKPRARGLP